METPIYKSLFRGSAWALAMRWSMRSIGFVNIIILARLLTPEDFGIVAMATIVLGFARSFTEMGAQQLLIRQSNISQDNINAAWTIHVLQGVLVAMLVLGAAPFAPDYFNDQRLGPVIMLLALVPLVDGFTNIGLTLARKELDFALDFRAQFCIRIANFFITLGLVLLLRNYWALVFGSILGSVSGVVISYLFHPYRPRLSSRGLGEYFRFATSIIPLRVAEYGNIKAAVFVAGGISSTAQLGIFNMAQDLAKLMSSEIAVPLARGLFPGYAKVNDDPPRLAQVFSNVLGSSATFIVPCGVGFGLVAPHFVEIVLGEQWRESVPYIQYFSIAAVVGSINSMLNVQILIVSGHEKRAALLSWLRFLLFVPSVVFVGHNYGILAIAQFAVVFSLAFFPISAFSLSHSIPITIGRILAVLIRPVLATLVMCCTVWVVNNVLEANPYVCLFAEAMVGAISYLASLYILWRLWGCPDGLERLVNDKIVRKLSPSTRR